MRACSVSGAADLQNRAVRTVEMLPADAVGMLNVTYEIISGERTWISIARTIRSAGIRKGVRKPFPE
jgi:hypothetical protein